MKPFRRAPVEELGEEAVEYEPSDQGDIIYQLGDKIRAQAKRLSALEQYKLLCEKRILELYPGHDMPVRPEHLGTQSTDPMRQQLHQAQQHIARLEQTLAGVTPQSLPEGWAREKQMLEESLRQEVLNSEKQRAYIETLKQALEVKMEGLGVKVQASSVEHFAQISQKQEQTEVIRREAERFKSVVKDQETVLRQREVDLSDTRRTASTLRVELEDTRQRFQQAQDDNKKLEIEKNTLMDYVQEQQQKESSLQSSVQALRGEARAATTQAAALSEQLKEAKSSLSASLARGKQQEEQLQRLIAESTQAQVAFSQVKTALESAQAKAKDTANLSHSLQEQLATSLARNESLQTSIASTTAELKDTRQARDQLRIELDSSNKQRLYLQDTLRSTKEALGAKESAELRLKAEVKELKRTYQNLQEESADMERSSRSRMEEISKALADTETSLADFRGLHEQQVEEMNARESQLKDLHDRKIDQLEGHITALENELKASRSEANSRLKAAETDNQRLTKAIRELQESLQMANTARDQLEADHRQTHLKLSMCSEDKTNLQHEFEYLKEDLAASKAVGAKQLQTLRALQEEGGRLEMKVQAEERERVRLQVIVKAANEENESLKGNLDALQRDLEAISDNVARNSAEMGNTKEQLMTSRMREQELFEELSRIQTFVNGKVAQIRFIKSQTSNSSLMQLLTDLFAALETLDSDYDSLRKENDSLKVSTSNLNQDLSSAKSTISTLLKSSEMLKDENSQFAHELDLTRAQLDQRHLEASDHISRVSGELADTQKDNHSLRREMTDLREQLGAAEEELNRLRAVHSQLQYELQGAEARTVDSQREKRSMELLTSKIVNAIPSAAMKSIALEMMQVKGEMQTFEKSHTQARARVLDLEGELSLSPSSRDSAKLHRVFQSENESMEHTEASIHDLRRRMQSLELALQETEASERRKFEEIGNMDRTISELQSRLDRKSAELMETQYSLLRYPKSPSRSPSPYKTLSYEPRPSPQPSVQDRLEQARATIDQLKRLSRSAIS